VSEVGAFIAKQPNGLYCRFSTVTDCITHDNMTAEFYIKMCMNRAKVEAESILANNVRPFSEIIEQTKFMNIHKDDFQDWLKSVGYDAKGGDTQ
jgi:hypothetical protein